jgi:hypothetical protein
MAIGNEGQVKYIPSSLHPLFFCGKLGKNILHAPIGQQPSVVKDERQERFSYPVSRVYKCKILVFSP